MESSRASQFAAYLPGYGEKAMDERPPETVVSVGVYQNFTVSLPLYRFTTVVNQAAQLSARLFAHWDVAVWRIPGSDIAM